MDYTNEASSAGPSNQDSYPQQGHNDHSSIRSPSVLSYDMPVPQAPLQIQQVYQPYQIVQGQVHDLPLPPQVVYYRPVSPIFLNPEETQSHRASINGNLPQEPFQQQSNRHASLGAYSLQYDHFHPSPSKHQSLGSQSLRSEPPFQPTPRHFSLGAPSIHSYHSRSSTPPNDKRRLTDCTAYTTASPSKLQHELTWMNRGAMTPDRSLLDMTPKQHSGHTSSESVKENLSEKTAVLSSPTPNLAPPAPKWSKAHNAAFILCVCMAQFLTLAGLAQTVAPLLIIGADMKVTNPGQLSWFTAAYSMTLGTFILPSGRMGDMFGHKRMFLLGWLWFSLFSFLAGFSHAWGPIAFSITRGFQGIGPALLVPNAMALIGRTYPIGDKRALVFSIFGACGPTGFLTGSFFSSILAQYANWPWVFWATAVASTIITFFAYCVIPDSMAQRPIIPGQPEPKFDYLGTFTGVSGLILINFVLNQAPLVGWDTPYIYFLLIIGVLMTCGFFYVELYMTDQPLLPIRGLQSQAVWALACIAAGWASHGIWIYYLYLFQMRIRQYSPLLTTACLFPVAPLGIMFALSTNTLIKRVGVAKTMFTAMMFFLAGALFLAFVPEHQTYWAQTFVSILIMPGGMNLSFPAGTILLSNAMSREHQGKAASLVSTVVNYSIASGLGFAGSIESSIHHHGGTIMEGFRGPWYLGIGFSGLGVVISLYFMYTLRRRV